MEVRGFSSLLPPCGLVKSNTGYHTWQQALLSLPVSPTMSLFLRKRFGLFNIAIINVVHGFPFSYSGGISIKASANMDLMRADMGGAATICSAIVSAAKLNLPINIIGKEVKGCIL